jgi:hypothetical protein
MACAQNVRIAVWKIGKRNWPKDLFKEKIKLRF